MQKLTLEWDGDSYEFKPSHDLYMRIEEKIAFNRLATMFERAAASDDGRLDMPMSQISWVIYCVMKHCGISVRTPMDVHQALFDAERLPNYGEVLGGLIASYYGAMPERPIKKKPVTKAKAKASPR